MKKWGEPVYPVAAKKKGIRGTVRLKALVGKDAHVLHVESVSGNPVLVNAAKEAVTQWIYRPYLLNGEPIEVAVEIQVSFPRVKPTPRRGAIVCG
jgi:periplasmic protein TonB